MAKVTSMIMRGMSGRIGDVVVRQTAAGPVAAKAPPSGRRGGTPAQQAHKERFRKATVFAKANASRPEYQAAAKKKGLAAYVMAVTDFMRPPVIEEIELREYTGRPKETIRARIEYIVVGSALIQILGADGREVEAGTMTRDVGHRWSYHTTRTVQRGPLVIRIEATDLAGNRSVLDKEIDWSRKLKPQTPPPAAPAPREPGLREFLRRRAQAERASGRAALAAIAAIRNINGGVSGPIVSDGQVVPGWS